MYVIKVTLQGNNRADKITYFREDGESCLFAQDPYGGTKYKTAEEAWEKANSNKTIKLSKLMAEELNAYFKLEAISLDDAENLWVD